jgi:hypothetical protein
MVRAIAAAMETLFRTLAVAGLTLLLSAPADAIVGGGAPSAEGVGRAVVTIVGSRGNFCTGALIAPKLVLTAAHCVQPGAEYKIRRLMARTQLQDVKTVRCIPASMQAMLAHRATADVALLQLETPAKGKTPAALGIAWHSGHGRQPLHHCRHRRDRARRRQGGGAIRVAGWSRPASRGHCKSGWSIPWDRAPATDLAPVPGIPALRCSRTSRAGPSSSASSVGRPGRMVRRVAAD